MGDEDYPSSPASPRITPEEARLLWEVVESHCGLSYSFGTASYLERRALPRLRALGLGSFREYFLHLRYGESREQELGILIEQLTNHETYFFRERYQLEAFRLEVLPQLVTLRRQYRLLNVWSAGCSTGEEAYTVAMLLSDAPELEGWNYRVFGTDISQPVLRKARAGVYGPSSFRTTTDEERARYFVEEGKRWAVRDEIRARTAFGHLNLLQQDKLHLMGACDAIFCRNVLIYLSAAARAEVVETFYDRLRPGGVLMLGHSESLLNVSTRFEILNLEQDLVYQKPREDDDG